MLLTIQERHNGIIECADCGKHISDQATMCVNCGRPLQSAGDTKSGLPTIWAAVTRSKTPINLFALAMSACAAVLGVAAVKIDNKLALQGFTFKLHMFLAITGMFFVTLLFSRTSIYHPTDLAKAKQDGFEEQSKDRPVLAAILILFLILAYGLYQAKKSGYI